MEPTVVILIAIIIVAILAMFYIPRLMINRAIHSVIRILRRSNAVTIQDAKTLEELGLDPKPFMQRAFKLRDYKPYALQILRNADIVQVSEDGRLYLDEGQLQTSKWRDAKG
jgi:hypothetical protein